MISHEHGRGFALAFHARTHVRGHGRVVLVHPGTMVRVRNLGFVVSSVRLDAVDATVDPGADEAR